jgi:hypothetical protein
MLVAMKSGAVSPAYSAAANQTPLTLFFDERFPASRQLARRLSPNGRLIPTRGDVTDILRGQLLPFDRASNVAGITTESFSFCLDRMARDHARTRLDIERLDRNLYAWTLRLEPGSRGRA